MRDIKFRAYRILDNADKPNMPVMTKPFTLGNLQDREQFDFTDGSYLSADELGLEHPDTILMQYTGLKDKKGKEVYEGDVVELWMKSESGFPEKELHTVVWDEDRCGFRLADRVTTLYGFSKADVKLEVIGNVFENPELMEGEK